MTALTESYHLPELLRQQITAAYESGLYTSEAEVMADAIRTLLAARPDVRLAAACRLYEQGSVSLGKAAELAGLDLVSMKATLKQKGIERVAPESATNTATMAQAALRAAGR